MWKHHCHSEVSEEYNFNDWRVAQETAKILVLLLLLLLLLYLLETFFIWVTRESVCMCRVTCFETFCVLVVKVSPPPLPIARMSQSANFIDIRRMKWQVDKRCIRTGFDAIKPPDLLTYRNRPWLKLPKMLVQLYTRSQCHKQVLGSETMLFNAIWLVERIRWLSWAII